MEPAPAPAPAPRPDSGSDWDLSPDLVSRLGRLELVSRLVIEGMASGKHRSPVQGASIEFSEHRPYGPGDEIRKIDWRAYGKHERYYVKAREDETNVRATLIVDGSGSMGYAGTIATASKLERAKVLAATLARLLIAQRDIVGLAAWGEEGSVEVAPRSAPGHLSVLCSALDQLAPGGSASWGDAIAAIAERSKRRGLIAIFSDGFADLNDLTAALRGIRQRHHELIFFQILAPEETTFPFGDAQRFQDLESGDPPLLIDPDAIRDSYLEAFQHHCGALRQAVEEFGGDFETAMTNEPPELTLSRLLASRSRSGMRARTRRRLS